MKPRFTSWVLAALLALATPVAIVPASATVTPSYGIVRLDVARPQVQNISERLERGTAAQPPAQSVLLPEHETRRPVLLLDQSLFQRPPPFDRFLTAAAR